MRKFTALALTALLAATAAGCGTRPLATDGGGGAVPLSADEIGGEITVSCYDSMIYQSFLEEAAALFEVRYPGTKVHVESFSAMPEIKTVEQDGMVLSVIEYSDDPQARADYISRVSTSLMGGGGADVLAMDVLPLYKYAAAGQLEDLGAYMDADPHFNRDDYNARVFDALRFGDGTWFLPVDYSFDYFSYDATLAAQALAAQLKGADSFTYAQLLELGAAAGIDEPLFFDDEPALFQRLLNERYGEFVDVEGGEAHFNDGAFEAMLESLSGYAQRGLIQQSAVGEISAEDMLSLATGLDSDERSLFRLQSSFSLLNHFTRDLEDTRLMVSFGGAGGGNEGDDEIAAVRANAAGGVPFTYSQAYGINSGSANKQTAWAFVKFLLGEDMQSSPSMLAGLPVHNASRAAVAEMMFSGDYYGGEETAPSQATLDALERYKAAVETLSSRIDSFVVRDPAVDDMIDEEVAAFFDGEKSAAEVAAALQSRAALYLDE